MPLIIGDVLPFAATVEDGDGVLHDADLMTLTVTRPDGTAFPGSPFTVASSTTGEYDRNVVADQVGRWVGLWQSTGTYAGAYAQVFDVELTARPTWAPTLSDVAVHIPTRTRELRAPVAEIDEYAGTFTDATTPTGEQAEALILRACDWVAARVGTPLLDAALPLCKLAATLLSAAWIERAYPERDADLTTYQQLHDDAEKAIQQARDTNVDAGGSGDTPDADLPVNVQYAFPDRPGWADLTFL